MKKLYYLINKQNERFWERIIKSTSSSISSLCAFRIIAGLFILFFSIRTYGWIETIPSILFDPPLLSISNLFSSFPSNGLLQTIDFILLASIICITLGIKARLFTIIFLVLSSLGNSFVYSFGKIDHDILLYIFLMCMSFSGWGSDLALYPDKPVKEETFYKSLSLLSVFICFGMFTAGYEKALNWVDFDFSTNGFASWIYPGFYQLKRTLALAPYIFTVPFVYLDVFDYAAITFELSGFLFLLASRKAWNLWLLIACVFHLANALFLNIPFTVNLLPYLSFINYSKLFSFMKNNSKKPWLKTGIGFLLASGTLIVIPYIISKDRYMGIIYFLPEKSSLYIICLMWVTAAFIFFKELLAMNRKLAGV
ncbi:hypothetical protein [Rufibacter hautae]|uniref:HTTM domain-containing protein n=1 Tax=Rufibacter hautae TaxID=2595005 RepID=A0A5B6TGT6_9BACT|nr:hypothetical protein [Rufibacter hautae]KAA3438472.1 hypothetical protein FOA19_14655 [Rufibacter hautae]